ncbi:MAG: hypothetical protein V1495_07140 [Pseudomonadota bacterium]
MKRESILVACLLSACVPSRPAPPPSAQHCLSQQEIDHELAAVRDFLTHFSEGMKEAPALLQENHCWKAVFLLNQTMEVVIYRDPLHASAPSAFMIGDRVQPSADDGPCLLEATKTIHTLAEPTAKTVFEEFRKTRPWAWNDLDIGPLRWIRCRKPKGDLDLEFLPYAVHELTHALRRNSCLFFAPHRNTLCFDLGADLPSASIPTLPPLAANDPIHARKLQETQEMYFSNPKINLLSLLDELNAYTNDLKTMRALVSRYGEKLVFPKDRPMILLPLFLRHTARYVVDLRHSNPTLFGRYLAPRTPNRIGLEVLLREAETAFSKQKNLFDFESTAWAEYLRLKDEIW